MKLPTAPSLPSPPAIPTAPALPAVPSVPPLPSAPSLPAPPAAGPATPAPAPAPAPSAGGAPGKTPAATVEGPPEDIDVSSTEKKPESTGGVPSTLPPALKATATKAEGVPVNQQGGALTLEELVNVPVTSVSNRREGSQAAPAWVITITGKELQDRGYTQLSQIFDDLPGMDVSHAYGRAYVKSTWRGFRAGDGSDPYLVLIDGIPYSHLFFNDAQIFTTFPMTDIDHVEVVYGPASVAHGINATSGIINVVTVDGAAGQKAGEYGSHLTARMTFGGPQRNLSSFEDSSKIVDATATWTTADWRVRLSARIQRAVLDRSIGDDFEYTKPGYLTNPLIWGAPGPNNLATVYPQMAGDFRSEDQQLGVDARVWIGKFEFGFQEFRLQTGAGTLLPTDRFQTESSWTTSELSGWVRFSTNIASVATATSLLRFRESDLAAPTAFVERQSGPNGFPDPGPRILGFGAPNQSVQFTQQFDFDIGHDLFLDGDQLNADAGLSYEHLLLSAGVLDQSDVLYPGGDATMAVENTTPGNIASDGRQTRAADDGAAFGLVTYKFMKGNWLNAGGRLEENTYRDTLDYALRAGYVGTFEPLTVKALFGQGVYAPSPYNVSQSQNSLVNTHAQSVEANASVTVAPISVSVSGWGVRYDNPIVNSANILWRQAIGLDAAARLLLRPFEVWLYYSHSFLGEEKPSADAATRPIGDIAPDKIRGGVTFERSHFVATLLGRFVSSRETVSTNPIREVGASFTLDLNAMVKDIGIEGTSLGLRVANLLDAQYFDPGIGTADSGNTPGAVAANGNWLGSRGLLNSLLPQPRRSLFLTLSLAL